MSEINKLMLKYNTLGPGKSSTKPADAQADDPAAEGEVEPPAED
jgi:hypothetical protein